MRLDRIPLYAGLAVLLALGLIPSDDSEAQDSRPAPVSDRLAQVERQIVELQARISRIEDLLVVLMPKRNSESARAKDVNSLRQIIGTLIPMFGRTGLLPEKDGLLDVYVLVRKRKLSEVEALRVFRSARSGVGPSLSEIRADDYEHFPYGRAHGPIRLGTAVPIPVLWDKAPDASGRVLVAYNSGAIKYISNQVFDEDLRATGQR